MSKVMLKRNTNIESLKSEIDELREKCAKLYRNCRDTYEFDSVKHDQYSKEIERLEYHLWGARNGNRRG